VPATHLEHPSPRRHQEPVDLPDPPVVPPRPPRPLVVPRRQGIPVPCPLRRVPGERRVRPPHFPHFPPYPPSPPPPPPPPPRPRVMGRPGSGNFPYLSLGRRPADGSGAYRRTLARCAGRIGARADTPVKWIRRGERPRPVRCGAGRARTGPRQQRGHVKINPG